MSQDCITSFEDVTGSGEQLHHVGHAAEEDMEQVVLAEHHFEGERLIGKELYTHVHGVVADGVYSRGMFQQALCQRRVVSEENASKLYLKKKITHSR